MATYKEIQSYIKEKYKCSIKTCWIAHMKEICGLKVNIAHNRYDINSRTNPCPKNKMYMIEEAFRNFKML